MKKLLILSLLLLPTMALAQQPLLATTEVDLKVTLLDAEKIWKGLRKLPVEEVEELMNKLRQQVATQTQPKQQDNQKDVPTPFKP